MDDRLTKALARGGVTGPPSSVTWIQLVTHQHLGSWCLDVNAPSPRCWCGSEHATGWDLPTRRTFGGRPFHVPVNLWDRFYAVSDERG